MIENEENWKPLNECTEEDIVPELPEHSITDGANGWLAPDGTLYPCPNENHNTLQYNIQHHLNIEDIEDQGWIKLASIMATNHHSSKSLWFFIEDAHKRGKVTQSQQDTLFDWCMEHKIKYPAFMRE